MKKVLVNEELLWQVLDALEAADKRDGVYSYRCEINALHALFDAPVQECGYDETTGSCTRNPCCAVAPVQEPVAYVNNDGFIIEIEGVLIAPGMKLYTAPVQDHADWNKRIRDSVDSLLEQAGYQPDSSVRHQLAMMNFDPSQPNNPVETNTNQNSVVITFTDRETGDGDLKFEFNPSGADLTLPSHRLGVVALKAVQEYLSVKEVDE